MKEKRAVESGTGDLEVVLVTGVKGNKEVATVDIPPFITMPDMIVWGGRSFKKTDHETDNGDCVYSEAFVYHAAVE
jgi:hypothetical protein